MKLATILILCFLLRVTTPGLANEQQVSISREQVISSLLQRNKALFALSLVYQRVPNSDYAPHVEGGYFRRTIAARGPSWFRRDNSHGHNQMHWKDDPNRKIRVMTPEKHLLLDHLSRTVQELPTMSQSKDVRESLYDELLFHWLCWWPYSSWTPPTTTGREWTFDVLFKDDRYGLRTRLEDVDSRPCIVLEIPHLDVLWLDAERPECILRREVYDGKTGFLAERLEFQEYREVAANIWLPARVRDIYFDPFAHTEHLRSRRVIDSTFVISDVLVNERVTDEVFSLELPPGTVRHVSKDGTVVPVREGQAAHLVSLADWATKMRSSSKTANYAREFHCTISALVGLAAAFCISAAFNIRNVGRR